MIIIKIAGGLLLGLTLLGCAGSPSPSSPSPSPSVAPAPQTPPPASDAGIAQDLAAPASALLRAQGLFSSAEGTQEVWLDDQRRLHVGALSIAVDHVDPATYSYAWQDQAALELADLSGQEKVVVLSTPTPDDEDPPNRYQVFMVRNHSLVQVLDIVVGAYGMHPLLIPGDGTVRYVEDGWAACERLGYPTRAIQQEVILQLDASLQMVEVKRNDSASVQLCEDLAACPMVYRMEASGPRYQGEILRNIRGREAYTTQTLALDGVQDKFLELRVAEEKPEVSFIDELYVRVDGLVIYPSACAQARAPAICAADQVPLVLREGDSLQLRFEIPAAQQGQKVELVASGYYRPTPTAHLRHRP